MGTALLSTLIFTPIVLGVVCLLVGDKQAMVARCIAAVGSVAVFLLSLSVYSEFDTAVASMQLVEELSWISAFNIHYRLGVDGISMPLILLSTFTTVVAVFSAWEVIQKRVNQYMAAFLILEGFMIGVFSALDAILFYVFWEALLIPMFLIIGIWGGDRRAYATIKFFLYTFLGSVFMLIAFIYMYLQSGSFAIADFYALPLGLGAQTLIFFAFLAAFAIKIPMLPVHTWLPDAHVEAPTAGSVILAAVLLKMGGYGFIRFSLPITPDAASEYAWLMIVLSLLAIVYIAFIALVQRDMKKLIAYSSISHMGFVTLGIFVVWDIDSSQIRLLALEGAMVQMISHGFISSALFLSVGVLYDRLHSRQISDYGGVVNTMPVFGFFAVFFALANAGLPGTSGFVGEFMVILAAFQANIWYSFIAALTLILGAAYTLWMIKRVFYGPVANDRVARLSDIGRREKAIMSALAAAVLILGVWPDPVVDILHASSDSIIQQALSSKLR